MDTVIVAFENPALCRRFSDLLDSTGTARCLTCRSGDQVRRLLSKQTAYCAICSPHLTDGPAEWLCEDLPPVCSLLLVGPQHMLDACGNQEALNTVRMLLQFGRRMERYLRPRRSGADQELVDRAKALIIERKGLSEEEAHRLLQRRSMDSQTRMSQTARLVISELELSQEE